MGNITRTSKSISNILGEYKRHNSILALCAKSNEPNELEDISFNAQMNLLDEVIEQEISSLEDAKALAALWKTIAIDDVNSDDIPQSDYLLLKLVNFVSSMQSETNQSVQMKSSSGRH